MVHAPISIHGRGLLRNRRHRLNRR